MEEQGYTPSVRIWGAYPDTYLRVYEARSDSAPAFQFAVVLKLVALPHHIFVRDLNALVRWLDMVQPILNQTGRTAEDRGEALYGSQGADEHPADSGN